MSVDKMISKEGKNYNGKAEVSPLGMAYMHERLEIVQYLIKTCTAVDLVGRTSRWGFNSLHYAAMDMFKSSN